MRAEAVKTVKGRHTRRQILETALRLFRDRGYERTTMRAIAREAGVSLGSAYYYFGSKELLIQAFYARTHEEHLAACEPVLRAEKTLEARLRGVLRAKLDTIAPYHRFAGALFRTAADPRSPLNPFSQESAAVRDQAVELFARVVEGSSARITRRLRDQLPYLLWTYHMGIVLFWIHDDSPGCARSYLLADRTVGLVARLSGLAGLPLMRGLTDRALRLVSELRASEPTGPEVTR